MIKCPTLPRDEVPESLTESFEDKLIGPNDVRKAQVLASLAEAAIAAQRALLLTLPGRSVWTSHANASLTELIAQIGLFAEVFDVQEALSAFTTKEVE